MDGMWKVCPEAGGQIQFPGFNGNRAVVSGFYLLSYLSVQPLSLINQKFFI